VHYKSENSRLKVAIFLHDEDDRRVFLPVVSWDETVIYGAESKSAVLFVY
jgi:hypothetical protein